MPPKSSQNKKAVIDVSVILYDALAVKSFKKTDVYIPLALIEEISRWKRDMGENGKNARRFSRFMDSLRSKGLLTEGVPIDSDSRLYLTLPSENPLSFLKAEKTDNQILGAALELKKQFPKADVQLVSKDITLRLKAEAFGIKGRDYNPGRLASAEEMYSGLKEMEIEPKHIDFFLKEGFLPPEKKKLFANQYVIMKSKDRQALGRYDKKQNKIKSLLSNNGTVRKVHPRTPEQSFALDALLNEEILLVSLTGHAGTGKTLLALAGGLCKTVDQAVYKRLLVSRPVFPMGRDIGYLPGDIEQKLNPWMQPVFDSLEFILGIGKRASTKSHELMNQGLLSIEPLAYIRGRSITRQYLIVDEAQNLTPHEIKTVITRMGTGSKLVLTGDCHQIDNPYMDGSNSGLTRCVEKFKDCDITAHINLTKGERSALAELGASIL